MATILCVRATAVGAVVLALCSAGCSDKGKVHVNHDYGTLPDDTTNHENTDDPGKERGRGRSVEAHANGPLAIATLPGFHMYEDGTSRVFIEISGDVPVSEAKTETLLTFRFDNVLVSERVNRLHLPTTHFETPVALVQVVQVLGAAELRIYLRQTTEATTRLKRNPGGTVLSVDFPRLRPGDVTNKPIQFHDEEPRHKGGHHTPVPTSQPQGGSDKLDSRH